jgi:hypothetical protein
MNRYINARKRRKYKGVQFIEFSLILPIMLYLMLLSIDMGRLVFLSGIVHDAAFYSARQGAIQGGAEGVSQAAFEQALSRFPGSPMVSNFRIDLGNRCSATDLIVQVTGEVETTLITPGLRSLLNASSTISNEGPWRLKATGIGYCEISRQ